MQSGIIDKLSREIVETGTSAVFNLGIQFILSALCVPLYLDQYQSTCDARYTLEVSFFTALPLLVTYNILWNDTSVAPVLGRAPSLVRKPRC